MSEPLENFKETGQNTISKMLEHSGADGALIMLAKGNELMILAGQSTPLGKIKLAMGAGDLQEKLMKEIESDPMGLLAGLLAATGENVECSCPKCVAKREAANREVADSETVTTH